MDYRLNSEYSPPKVSAKLIRSPDNPGGIRLPALLRKIRIEVEGQALARDRGASRGVALQVAGLLLIAEGILEMAEAVGFGLESFPPPKLVPSPRR